MTSPSPLRKRSDPTEAQAFGSVDQLFEALHRSS